MTTASLVLFVCIPTVIDNIYDGTKSWWLDHMSLIHGVVLNLRLMSTSSTSTKPEACGHFSFKGATVKDAKCLNYGGDHPPRSFNCFL